MSTGSDPYLTLAAWLSDEDGAPAPPALGAVRLPRLVLRETLSSDADLVLGEVLGEGGMAVVRSAQQVALDRDVAVKQTRNLEPAAVAGLVREAVIGAKLSHPNIVPVHFVGETDEGEPIVVMRKIGGLTWGDLAKRADIARGRHIQVFHALCRALAYAHDAGFVHRDVKPSNVRIGDFGEIYLLDWGIAAALDHRERAPAGTPAYMAPEVRRVGPVDVRHDVFGLAASLLEVLQGSVTRDEQGGLAPSETLPDGLRAVLARAGAADPASRTATIEQLRLEVEAWQEDREVEALREAARAQEARLAAAGGIGAAREQFAIARFAWSSVVERRPADPEAQAGMARCSDRIVRAELQAGQVEAAEDWLASHPAPSESITAEVAAARVALNAATAEDDRLREVARAADVSTIRSILWRLVFALLVSLAVSMLINRALLGPPSPGKPEETAWRLVGMVIIPWVVSCGLVAWHWRELSRSIAGQRSALAMVAFGSLFLFVRIGTAAGGLLIDDRPGALAYEPIVFVAFALGMANLSRRFLVAAAVGVVTWTAVIASFWDDARITLVYNLAMFVTMLFMVWGWEDVQRGAED
ncbi:MAG: serine/threonine protein kinase [Deltaproteobacteria bacterium]|nr:MAG: serine/threonine protein kinase [Deltaproteobacteria bacterium]